MPLLHTKKREKFVTFTMSLFSLSFFYMGNVQAAQLYEENFAASGWYAGGSIGMMIPHTTHSTYYAPSGMPGFPEDKYVANNEKNAARFSLSTGYQWQRHTEWLPVYSLGLEYAYSKPEIRGVIYQNSLPDAKNFRFKYDVSQQLILLKLKTDLYQWHQFMPFITAGAGIARNNVQNYSESPIPGQTVQIKGDKFSSNTTTQFASSIGTGIDYWIDKNSQLSLGYEYISYGDVKTGPGHNVLSAHHLTNQLYAHSFDLQAKYFF